MRLGSEGLPFDNHVTCYWEEDSMNHYNRVVMIITKEIERSVISFIIISDRIILLLRVTKKKSMNIILTSGGTRNAVEEHGFGVVRKERSNKFAGFCSKNNLAIINRNGQKRHCLACGYLLPRCRDINVDYLFCILDYEKAFHTINWSLYLKNWD